MHAADTLGTSKSQITRHVIVPNSLQRSYRCTCCHGVCWRTVVAAEFAAAERDLGKIIVAVSKFQDTDIIPIGIIGFGIDVLMRWGGK